MGVHCNGHKRILEFRGDISFYVLLCSWLSGSSFDSLCRLCLLEDDSCSRLSRPLYVRAAGFRGSLSVREMLNQLLQTRSYDEDTLPQNICDSCLDTVLRFFTFVQHCRRTEKQLVSKLATLSKLVSSLHSQVVRQKKKSKFTDQNTAILTLSNKNIEFLNFNDSELNKLHAVHMYINHTLSSNNKIQGNNAILRKASIVKTIKSHEPLRTAFGRSKPLLKFYCNYCPENFACKNELAAHLNCHHHIVDVAECNECGKKFKTIQLLKQHATIHRETNSKCIICGATFDSPGSLESHVNEEHTEYKFKCPDCHELFERERDISIHQWNSHKIGYEYYCKVCGKKFNSFYAVKSHEDQHDGFDCERCGQKFNTRLKLKTHHVSCLRGLENPERIFSDIEKYICHYCKKHFYRKATLRQHILNLHMYPKRFKCSNCAKRVSTKTQLEAHMVVHTRERTEQCSVCGKYFVTKYALAYHMRLHTGERPYPCDMCDERFLSASRRMAHMKRKHIGRTEQCNVCSKSYYSGYALKRHMQRHLDPKSALFENS